MTGALASLVMRPNVAGSFVLVLALAWSPFAAAEPQNAAASSDSAIKADVQRSLAGRDLGASSRLTVDVVNGVVTLSGTVPTLWSKEEAVRRTLKADRVQSVVVELKIARAESDGALADAVVDRIRRYGLYTIYDDIQGSVQGGAVRLTGAVTEPKKAQDIILRVAKVRGVQAIDNEIEVLPASQGDNRLRVSIANAIYNDVTFENYSIRSDPPIHVIVNNSHVTLVGFVQSQLERFKANSLARGVFGVFAVEDKLELVGGTRAR